jgi:hypothetical protein
MDALKMQIPFVLNNKNGIVEVCYEENKSAGKSGFDLLEGLGFDVEMCMGYPTMNAYIRDYEGTGYYRASAWIQIITDKYYSVSQDKVPSKVISEVDISENMRRSGVPFFALGYPAEIYDAPCNNLSGYARLEWIADTFLVTQPSRINDDTISYITGFRWGYEEWDMEGKRNVRILPLEIIDASVWNGHLPMLKEEFSNWQFR